VFSVLYCCDAALDELFTERNRHLELCMDGGPGFRGEDFIDAVVYLMDNGGVVTKRSMQQHLGRFTPGGLKAQQGAGWELLLAMLKFNALHMRAYSKLATDIPVEKYGTPKGDVVTAATPLDLYCMMEQAQYLRELAPKVRVYCVTQV
jgi:hypothetical protein